ncbi:MAG: hypothetical protein JSW28_06245 [Thermoplasmata archaeon]|nr:MAG: hypothetical protein JSW28_06245 [Thermoplasmata archaeon]
MQQPICHACQGVLIWDNAQNQWFCQQCNVLYPPAVPPPKSEFDRIADELGSIFDSKPQQPVYYCNICSTPLGWIQEHGRWYCYTCKKYV